MVMLICNFNGFTKKKKGLKSKRCIAKYVSSKRGIAGNNAFCINRNINNFKTCYCH